MCLSRRRLTIEHFPIFLDLKGRHALVLGSGEAATRKAEALSRAGAIVRRAERFQSALLTGCAIAIGADAPDAELRALSRAARDAGIPVNVVDQPALCSFISPATVERGALTIAIGSGGSAPMLARAVRARIEALLPPGLGRVADLLDELKDELRRRFPDLRARRRIIERLLDGPAGASANAGDASAARLAARQVMFAGEDRPAGMVFLVGGGPGAADLLTLRAQRLLGEADVIVHDRLVGDGVLDMARRDARRIFVGKQRAMHCMAQAEINALLIELAREGNKVVRLKGGDPFVFGRGGEEAEACARAGIYCEVVPGVTAALACAAQAGIPLTHREAARTVTFVTGHTKDGRLDLDFQTLSRLGGTLVIYMGVETLAPACRGLREGGLPDATPAVLVERGGTAQVRVLRGTLADLAERAVAWGTGGPALVLIGEAAGRRVDMAIPAECASAAPAAGPLALAG
jgi:uroporphyrin-III C-methyltransferase/precorrin-2 dehydrogenase/sirohydrochlorin ferrochelatase